jgi:hypothetical protein
VAQRLVRNLQAALDRGVPQGRALVITVTAPIRLPARTVVEVLAHLERPIPKAFNKVVCGNRVRAQMVRAGATAPRVVVFVHNPQRSVRALIDLVEAWLGH